MKAKFLRKKYPKFIYKDYSYKISKKSFEIFFDFKIEPNFIFKPKLVIENINKSRIKKIKKEVLNNLVFHLGLIELLSYWKVTCSPKIEIRKHSLNKKQIKWWKDLIINGMGQFFYENKINWQSSNFIDINSKSTETRSLQIFPGRLKNRVLAPVGGGKDSIVTLEILKKTKFPIRCFSLNTTNSAKKVMKVAGCKKAIIVKRTIDPKLMELNRQGFLNGHTPFSAYLAFLSTLLAVTFDQKYIAFSNERSSNEGNLIYLGKEINHQYSKSFKFEKKFGKYSKEYLAKYVEYFSFLRPLHEVQIAKLFSRYPKYFNSFLSCNEAYKTKSGTKKPIGKWCGKCSKCLFIFTCLYPFINKEKLIKIFGQNLFKKKGLLSLMKELIGIEKFKPFECVGTKNESLIAFYLSWKKANRVGEEPVLLKYFKNKILPLKIRKGFVRGLSRYPKLEKESKEIMTSWNKKHNLPKDFVKILKKFRDS
ncbi:MAG: hypothetical protein ACKKMO_01420 [Candidatus Nealsonbacteria bacterium]